jgi:hypothetical protein
VGLELDNSQKSIPSSRQCLVHISILFAFRSAVGYMLVELIVDASQCPFGNVLVLASVSAVYRVLGLLFTEP